MSRGALTNAELNEFRRRLLSLEAHLTGKVSELEAEALRPTTTVATDNPDESPAHEADPAVRVAEDAVAVALLQTEEDTLIETRMALARLETGTFGKCQRCGHAVSRARLNAVPYARYCIDCASEAAH
jgi:RNA polymerase-binding transcription factor DksA